MMMSPNFLFVIERGTPMGGGLIQLTGHEVATRLSLTLLGAPPDAALLDAATAGELDTPEGIAARARILLTDERAVAVVRDFHGQWIGLQESGRLQNPPGLKGDVGAESMSEINWFLEDWFKNGSGKIQDLFLSPRALVTPNLALMYGVAAVTAATPVDLPPTQRAGLLTRLMFLGTHSNPPARGDFVLKQVLCAPIPQIVIMPPMAPEIDGATTRERFEQHSTNPCATGCHSLLDPVGFAFENYDVFGVWRSTESGKSINAATVLKIEKLDIDGPVNGPLEISQRIAASRTASDCLATHWFQYSNARPAEPQDQCSVNQLQEKLAASGGDVRELLVALTQVDAFRFARKEGL
jgi:hypothetical protein